jgi:hypothetical protein
MAYTDCLVSLVSTIIGHCKNALVRGSASSGQLTKLEQSTFSYISMDDTCFSQGVPDVWS